MSLISCSTQHPSELPTYLLLARQSELNDSLKRLFSRYCRLVEIDFPDLACEKGPNGALRFVERYCTKNSVEGIFVAAEHPPIWSVRMAERIAKIAPSVLLSFDDNYRHPYNRALVSALGGLVAADECWLSRESYRSVPSTSIPLANVGWNRSKRIERDVDVFFSGWISRRKDIEKTSRIHLVNEIQKGLPDYRVLINDTSSRRYTLKELRTLQNRARLVLNFAGSTTLHSGFKDPLTGMRHPPSPTTGFKGRIPESVEAGACVISERFCCSERSYPSLMTFDSAEEAVELVRHLLSSERMRVEYLNALHGELQPHYQLESIAERLASVFTQPRDDSRSTVDSQVQVARSEYVALVAQGRYSARRQRVLLRLVRPVSKTWSESVVLTIFSLISGASVILKRTMRCGAYADAK